MKYKILTDGKSFIIKYNSSFFCWETVSNRNEVIGNMYYHIIYFDTEEKAELFAEKEWGKSRKRIRKWKIT